MGQRVQRGFWEHVACYMKAQDLEDTRWWSQGIRAVSGCIPTGFLTPILGPAQGGAPWGISGPKLGSGWRSWTSACLLYCLVWAGSKGEETAGELWAERRDPGEQRRKESGERGPQAEGSTRIRSHYLMGFDSAPFSFKIPIKIQVSGGGGRRHHTF